MLFYVYLDVEFIQFLQFSYCHISVIIKIFSEQLTFQNGVAVIRMQYVCPRYVCFRTKCCNFVYHILAAFSMQYIVCVECIVFDYVY